MVRIRLGRRPGHGVIFRDNEFINTSFGIDATPGEHTYERQ